MKFIGLFMLSLLLVLSSCAPPAGNEELAQETFGLKLIPITQKNITTRENGLDLVPADPVKIKVRVMNTNDEPVANTQVNCSYSFAGDYAEVLTPEVLTDDDGYAACDLTAPEGYAETAFIMVRVADTKLSTIYTVTTIDRARGFVILAPGEAEVGKDVMVNIQVLGFTGDIIRGINTNVILSSTGSTWMPDNGIVNIVDGAGQIFIRNNMVEQITLSLTDSGGSGLDTSFEHDMVFAPTGVSKYVVLDPIDGTTDAPVEVIVEAQDDFGNMINTHNGSFTLSLVGSESGNPQIIDIDVDGLEKMLGNERNLNMFGGRKKVKVFDSKAETVTISLKDAPHPSINIESSQDVVISAGTPFKFVVMDPVDGPVDNPIPVEIQAQDKYGNQNLDYNLDVTLHATKSATVANSGLVDLNNGVGFIDVSNAVAETVTVYLEDTQGTNMNIDSSQDIEFLPGEPVKIVMLDPIDGTVDNPIEITVHVYDIGNNLVTNYQNDVTITTDGSAQFPNSTNTQLINIEDGIGTIMLSNTVVETVNLNMTDTEGTTLDVSSSQDVFFDVGGPHHFTILNPTDTQVGNPIAVTVEARDQFDNFIDDYEEDVTLNVSGSATIDNAGIVDITAGTGTLNINNTVAETVDLTLSDHALTGMEVSHTEDAVFLPGDPDHWAIVDPTDGSVDNPVDVTVEMRDVYENVVWTYTDDVRLEVDGDATVPNNGDIDVDGGKGVIQVTNTTVETVNLSLLDQFGTGYPVTSTQDLYFAEGEAVMVVIVDPTDGTVDGPVTVAIEVQDQYGNLVPTYTNDFTLNHSGSASGGGVFTITDGKASVEIEDTVSETVILSLTDHLGLNTLDVDSTQDVYFAPGEPFKFFIADPIDGTVDAPVPVTVQVQDQYGNLTPSYQDDVTLTANLNAVPANSGIVDIVDGQGTISVSDTVVETVTLRLIDHLSSGLIWTSEQNLIFSAGAPADVVIIDPPDGTVDAPVRVEMQAVDQYGNVANTFTGNVNLMTNLNATGGGNATFVAGKAAMDISDIVMETVTLSLTDGLPATNFDLLSTQEVFFDHGAPHHFAVLNPIDDTVDNQVTVTVEAQDQYDNRVRNYEQDIKLKVDKNATMTPANGTIDITAGSGTLLVGDQVAETVILSLSDAFGTGLDVTSTEDLVFSHGVPTQYRMIDPVDGSIDNPIPVEVRLLDQYTNLCTSCDQNVQLTPDGVTATTPNSGEVEVVDGIGIIEVSNTAVETIWLRLNNLNGETFDVTSSQDVYFSSGAAVKYVLLDPDDVTTDDSPEIIVEARDAFDNLATTHQADVSIMADGSAEGDGPVDVINGVGRLLSLTNAVAETVNLTLVDTFNTNLNVDSTQDIVFSPGEPVAWIIDAPAAVSVDFGATVIIEIHDAGGNVVTSAQDDVTLLTNDADSTVTGDGVVTITDGVGSLLLNNTVYETITVSLDDHLGIGLDKDDTADIVFLPGLPVKYLVEDPIDGSVDAPVDVKISAVDQFNNPVVGYNLNVDLTTTGSTATGGGLVDIDNGVGWMSISNTVSETIWLQLANPQDSGMNIDSSQDLFFDYGAPHHYDIVNPVDGTVDSPVAVDIQMLDQYDNLVANYTGDVEIKTTGSATGTGLFTLNSGTRTVSLSNEVAETVILSLKDSANTGYGVSDTEDLWFNHGVASQIVVIDPVDGTIDNPIDVEVQVQDQFGNVVENWQNDTTLASDSLTVGGTGLLDIVNGSAVVPLTNTGAETVILSIDDTPASGLTTSSTQDLIFEEGLVKKIVIIDPNDGTVDAPEPVTIEAHDQFGNVVAGYDGEFVLNATGNATGGGIFQINAGTATLNIADLTSETVILSLQDIHSTGLDITSTQDLYFKYGAPHHFSILDPTDGSVDGPVLVTVQMQDQYENRVYDYTGAIEMRGNPNNIGGDYSDETLTAGEGTFTITSTLPQTVELTLFDSGATGGVYDVTSTTQDVIFKPGAAVKFVITDPSDGTVDDPVQVEVQAQDQYGNVATDYQMDVDLTASGTGTITGAGTVDITNGLGYLDIADDTVETVDLALANPADTGMNIDSTQDVYFGHGAPASFVIIDPGTASVDDGADVTVEVRDNYGNLATTYNDDVTLNANKSATPDVVLVDINNGVGTVHIDDEVAETVLLTLTDTQFTNLNVDSTEDIVFTAGDAIKFVVIDPEDGTVANPVTVEVQAQDQYGNVVTSYNDNVDLYPTGVTASGGGTVNITNGISTIDISNTIAETVWLQLSNPVDTGMNIDSSQDLYFAEADAVAVVIDPPADGTVDNPVTVTIRVVDIYGNIVPNWETDFVLEASGSATGDGVIAISGGQGTMSISNQLSETVNLSLLDTNGTGLDVTSTEDIFFDHGNPHHFYLVDPTDATVDDTVTVTLQIQDQYNNLCTSATNTAELTTSSGTVSGADLDFPITNGEGTLDITNTKAETVNLSLTDSGSIGGILFDTTQDVVFGSGNAVKYVLQNPDDGTVDNPIVLTVEARDQHDNVVTDHQDDVNLVVLDSGTVGGVGTIDVVNGIGTISITNTVYETVNLTLANDADTLDVASTQDVIFKWGVAESFVLLDPGPATVDSSVDVYVEVHDQFGNRVWDFEDNVNMLANKNATGEGEVDIVNGTGFLPISDQVVETVRISMTNTAATSLDVSSELFIFFNHGSPVKFDILDPQDSVAGVAANVTVTLLDQYGNICTTLDTPDIDLVADLGAAGSSGTVDISQGMGLIPVVSNVSETVTLSLSGSVTQDITDEEDLFFEPAAAESIAIIIPVGMETVSIDDFASVQFKAYDQFGNLATGFTGHVDLVASGDATGAGRVDFVNGEAALSTLSNSTVETVTLSLDDSDGSLAGIDLSSENEVFFKWGAAAKIAIIDPIDGTVDGPVTVEIQVQDSGGNVVQDYTDDVKMTNDSGTAVMNPVDGTVDINSGIGLIEIGDQTAGTVLLGLDDFLPTNLNVDSTQDVVFMVGFPESFVITDPADHNVDETTTVTVTAYDQYGNIAYNYNNGVDVYVISGVALGAGRLDFESGIGSIEMNGTVANSTVVIGLQNPDDTGIDITSTQDFEVSAGDPFKFVIIDPDPTPGVHTVDAPVTVNVRVVDKYDNLCADYTGAVTLNTSTATSSTNPGDGIINISNGEGSILVADTKSETILVTLTDHNSPLTGLDASSAHDIFFNYGLATDIYFVEPEDGNTDDPVIVALEVRDQHDNIVLGYDGAITVEITQGSGDGATLINSSSSQEIITITAGVGNFEVTADEVGTAVLGMIDHLDHFSNVTPNASPTDPADQHVDIAFETGLPFQFVIQEPCQPITIDDTCEIVIEAQDEDGNLVTNYNNSFIKLTSTGNVTGTTLVQFIDGIARNTIGNLTAETVTLGLDDAYQTGLDINSTQNMVWDIGVPKKFVIIDPDDGTVDASVPVDVEVHDRGGNLIYNYETNIILEVTGSATGDGEVEISGGKGTLNISNEKWETVILSLNDTTYNTGLDDTSTQDLYFKWGVIHHVALLDPADVTVDETTRVELQAQDQYNNIVYDYETDIDIYSDPFSPTVNGMGTIDITQGIGETFLSNTVNETVWIHMDKGAHGMDPLVDTTMTQDVYFDFGAATHIVIIDPADSTVNIASGVELQVHDQYGNIVGDHEEDIMLLCADGNLQNTGVVNITNGTATQAVNTIVQETYDMYLFSPGGTTLNIESTQDIFFEAEAVDRFVLLDPTNGMTSDLYSLIVEARDQYGNINFNFHTDINVNSDQPGEFTEIDGITATLGTVDITQGVGQVDTYIQTPGTYLIFLEECCATSGTIDHITYGTQDVVVETGTPDKVVFAETNIIETTVDNNSLFVTIEVYDIFGNIIANWTDDIKVGNNGTGMGAGFINGADKLININAGTATFNVQDTVAETVTLDFADFNNVFTDNLMDFTDELTIVFDHGEAAKFRITSTPTTIAGETALIEVEAQDQYGNLHNDFMDDVTLNTNSFYADRIPSSGLVDIVNGVGYMNIYSEKAETMNLTLADTEFTNLNITKVENLIFVPAEPAKFTLTDPPNVTIDIQPTSTLNSYDRFNNFTSNWSGSVNINFTGSAVHYPSENNPELISINSGTATFSIKDFTEETVVMFMTDSSYPGVNLSSSQDIIFSRGAADNFKFDVATDTTVDGSTIITFKVYDVGGNFIPSYQNDVEMIILNSTTTSPIATSLPVSIDVVNGEGSLEIFNTVHETVTVKLQNPDDTYMNVDDTVDVVFDHGAPTQYEFVQTVGGTVPSTVTNPRAMINHTTDTSTQVTIRTLDQYGNWNNDYAGSVTMNTDLSGLIDGNPSTASISLAGGIATADIFDETMETITLSLVGPLDFTKAASTQQVFFDAGTPTEIFIITENNQTVVDSDPTNGLLIELGMKDQYGNINTTYPSTGGQFTANLSANASHQAINFISGEASFYVHSMIAGTNAMSLNETGPLDITTWPSFADKIFDPDVPDKLVFTSAPTNDTVKIPNTAEFDIEVQDQYDNRVFTYTGDFYVQLSSVPGPTGAQVNTSSTNEIVNVVNGVNSFVIDDLVSETVDIQLANTIDTITMDATQVYFAPGDPAIIKIKPPSIASTTTYSTVEFFIADAQGNQTFGWNGQFNVFFDSTTAYADTGDFIIDVAPVTETVIVQLTDSVGSITVKNPIAETVTISLGDYDSTTTTPYDLNMSDSKQIIFEQSYPVSFEFVPSGDGTLNRDVPMTVKAVDEYGTIVADWAGECRIGTNDPTTKQWTFDSENINKKTIQFIDGEATVDLGTNWQSGAIDITYYLENIHTPAEELYQAIDDTIVDAQSITVHFAEPVPDKIIIDPMNSLDEIWTGYALGVRFRVLDTDGFPMPGGLKFGSPAWVESHIATDYIPDPTDWLRPRFGSYATWYNGAGGSWQKGGVTADYAEGYDRKLGINFQAYYDITDNTMRALRDQTAIVSMFRDSGDPDAIPASWKYNDTETFVITQAPIEEYRFRLPWWNDKFTGWAGLPDVDQTLVEVDALDRNGRLVPYTQTGGIKTLDDSPGTITYTDIDGNSLVATGANFIMGRAQVYMKSPTAGLYNLTFTDPVGASETVDITNTEQIYFYNELPDRIVAIPPYNGIPGENPHLYFEARRDGDQSVVSTFNFEKSNIHFAYTRKKQSRNTSISLWDNFTEYCTPLDNHTPFDLEPYVNFKDSCHLGNETEDMWDWWNAGGYKEGIAFVNGVASQDADTEYQVDRYKGTLFYHDRETPNCRDMDQGPCDMTGRSADTDPRYCWNGHGHENTCEKRVFFPEIPFGYVDTDLTTVVPIADGKTGTSFEWDLVPGPPSQLVLNDLPYAEVGMDIPWPQAGAVKLTDAYQNDVTQSIYDTTVTMQAFLDSGCTNPAQGDFSVPTTPLVNGVTDNAITQSYNNYGRIWVKYSATGYDSACTGRVYAVKAWNGSYGYFTPAITQTSSFPTHVMPEFEFEHVMEEDNRTFALNTKWTSGGNNAVVEVGTKSRVIIKLKGGSARPGEWYDSGVSYIDEFGYQKVRTIRQANEPEYLIPGTVAPDDEYYHKIGDYFKLRSSTQYVIYPEDTSQHIVTEAINSGLMSELEVFHTSVASLSQFIYAASQGLADYGTSGTRTKIMINNIPIFCPRTHDPSEPSILHDDDSLNKELARYCFQYNTGPRGGGSVDIFSATDYYDNYVQLKLQVMGADIVALDDFEKYDFPILSNDNHAETFTFENQGTTNSNSGAIVTNVKSITGNLAYWDVDHSDCDEANLPNGLDQSDTSPPNCITTIYFKGHDTLRPDCVSGLKSVYITMEGRYGGYYGYQINATIGDPSDPGQVTTNYPGALGCPAP